MGVHAYRYLAGVLCALVCCIVPAANAQEVDFSLFDESLELWSPYDLALSATPEEPGFAQIFEDEAFEPAQMLAPQARQTPRMAQRPRRSAVTRRNQSLASVPFMIGDTGAGTCLTIGGPQTFAIEHPTLSCSRLNVSENNTALPTDRTFVSYRHFKNVTDVRLLTVFERNYNVDRYLLGTERTFFDGMMSLEMRLPLERRLTSNFGSNVSVQNPPFIVDPFIGGRQNELGNVSAMLKALLVERQTWALSAGLGVTVPTARDFTYGYHLDNVVSLEVFPGAPNPDTLQFTIEDFGVTVSNDTVFLAPFLAWQWIPKKNDRFFHQGFFQIEVAANPSRAHVQGGGVSTFADLASVPILDLFFDLPPEGRGTDIFAQSLMRLNLGCGYVLMENPQASCIKRLTSLLELHYTQTIQDPNQTSVPLDVSTFPVVPIPPEFTDFFAEAFTFGNERASTSIVNVATGLTANIGSEGRTIVTSGLILPVTQGGQRAFDLEYNLQVQRLY